MEPRCSAIGLTEEDAREDCSKLVTRADVVGPLLKYNG